MLHWIPHGGERRRGRPATRWGDDLEAFAKSQGAKWEDCAKDKELWQDLEPKFRSYLEERHGGPINDEEEEHTC